MIVWDRPQDNLAVHLDTVSGAVVARFGQGEPHARYRVPVGDTRLMVRDARRWIISNDWWSWV